MTERAFNKIAAGLQDAIDGNVVRVTFAGMDLASGPDVTSVKCPKCGDMTRIETGHIWPDKCHGCGVEFRFAR